MANKPYTNPSKLPVNMRDTTALKMLRNPAVLVSKGPWRGSVVSYDEKGRTVLTHESGAVMKIWASNVTVQPKKGRKQYEYANRKNIDDV